MPPISHPANLHLEAKAPFSELISRALMGEEAVTANRRTEFTTPQ